MISIKSTRSLTAELKKLQSQNWNVKSFSGKYKLKSVRKGRVNDEMAFNVDFTSGKLSGIDQAIAYCRMHGAAVYVSRRKKKADD